MKRILKITLLIMLLQGVLSVDSYAHGIKMEVSLHSPTVTVRSLYSDNEPISYAAVIIYAPGNNKTEYQNGRTDAEGIFAFVPNIEGNWKFTVDDEMGHRKELTINVAGEFLSRKQDGSRLSGTQQKTHGGDCLFWRLLAGLGLILGLAGIIFWLKTRKSSPAGKNKR